MPNDLVFPTNPVVYDKAFQLFTSGKNLTQIHKEVCKEFGPNVVKYSTIRGWSISNSWKDRRSGAFLEAHTEIAILEKDQILKEHREHLEAYQKVRQKGDEALDRVTIISASDAIKAVDVGVRGERFVRSSLINLQFAQALLTVILECVTDQETLNRIQNGIRKVVATYNQEDNQ